jgi:hypothetical protein
MAAGFFPFPVDRHPAGDNSRKINTGKNHRRRPALRVSVFMDGILSLKVL